MLLILVAPRGHMKLYSTDADSGILIDLNLLSRMIVMKRLVQSPHRTVESGFHI